MSAKKIPKATIKRLVSYLRTLRILEKSGVKMVASAKFADCAGVSAEQFRKDLSYFGGFGVRGKGYNVVSLIQQITKIMKMNEKQDFFLVGLGGLGSALVKYFRLSKNFQLTAVFDSDPEKIGTVYEGITVHSIEELEEVNNEKNVKIAVIAVRTSAAQSVANLLSLAGIKAILNLSPVQVTSPAKTITIHNLDLNEELDLLSYYL